MSTRPGSDRPVSAGPLASPNAKSLEPNRLHEASKVIKPHVCDVSAHQASEKAVWLHSSKVRAACDRFRGAGSGPPSVYAIEPRPEPGLDPERWSPG